MPEPSASVPSATSDVAQRSAAAATSPTAGVSGLPALAERWRCSACGNLTRFDTVRSSRVREFWHLDLAGEPRIEEAVTLDHAVAQVVCRWCGRDDAIEVVSRPSGAPP